jgi:hypothetical protein
MDLVIFEHRLISIPDEYVRVYEEKVNPFSSEVAEYLAVTSECTPFSSADELQKGVISGMREEVYVNTHRLELLFDLVMRIIDSEF